jgi:hypothetical protein
METKMPDLFALSHMELDEISLVPAGDNDLAKTVLSKAAPVETHQFEDAGDGTCKTCGKGEDDPAHTPVKKSLKDRIMDVLKGVPDDQSGTHTGDGVTIVINSTPGGEAIVPKTKEDILKSLPDEVRDDVQALVDLVKEEAEEDLLEALDEMEKNGGEDDEEETDDGDSEDEDDVQKVLAKADPSVRRLIEKMQSDTASALSKAQAAADALLDKEMLSKAAALKNIPGTPEEKAALLKEAYAVSDEFGKRYEQQQKAANAMLDEAHDKGFAPIGKDAPGDLTVGSEVEKKAEVIMKADPTLTREQAITKVYEDNPSLYDEEMKES